MTILNGVTVFVNPAITFRAHAHALHLGWLWLKEWRHGDNNDLFFIKVKKKGGCAPPF
jgi:hypothetical protein